MRLISSLVLVALAVHAYVPVQYNGKKKYNPKKEVKFNKDSAYAPVVQMHGMGDFAKNPLGMLPFKRLISKELDGVYVTNAQIGANPIADMSNGFLMTMDDQVEYFLKLMQNDTHLSKGFNAIGYSQGNLVIRGYIERYNDPPVLNHVSVHGPMMGVASLPQCNITDSAICKAVDEILIGHAVYDSFVQNHLAQANYYRDPMKLATYREKGHFLNDLNNEKTGVPHNPAYKTNLMKLQKLALVKALGDTMVWPNDSEWFGFFKDNSTKSTFDGKTTQGPWETEDWFGLEDMIKADKIDYLTTPGNHLQFDTAFLKSLVDTYFKGAFPPTE